MSKKLLALLVAVSTFCAFGCSDDDSDSCKTGEKRCDGNMTQTCVKGNWSKGTPCADGCDKATGECKVVPVACETAGEKRCDGKQLQVCKDGNWSKLEDCKDSCDDATKACKTVDPGTTPKEGDACDKSTFQQVCINGGANALVCWCDKDTKDCVVTKWNCANNDCKANAEKPLEVVCAKGTTEPPSDVPTTCVKGTSKGMCSTIDNQPYICGDKGTYYKGKCESGTCFACSDGWVGCGATEADVCKKQEEPKCTGEKVQTGGEEGTCCDPTTYQVSCINENANALICAKGAVKKWTCKDNICSVGSDNKVKCDNPDGTGGGSNPGGTDNLEDCTATSNAKCKAACAADGKGYYWNSKNVVTQDCPAKQLNCLNNNGKIVCIGDVTEETCDPSAKPAPTCTDDNTKVKYCDSNVNKFAVKPCATCVVKEGVYYCDGDDKLTDCTTLGSTDKCKGACTSETEGLRFSSREGKVVKWECKNAGEKCEADATGWLSCKK